VARLIEFLKRILVYLFILASVAYVPGDDKISSTTKLYSTLSIYYMNIQYVSSSRLYDRSYNRLQSVDGLLRAAKTRDTNSYSNVIRYDTVSALSCAPSLPLSCSLSVGAGQTRDAMLARVLAMSLCLCLSVTSRCSVETAERIGLGFGMVVQSK